MAKTTRLFKNFYRLVFPVIVLLLLAIVGASMGFIYKAAHPPSNKYLVTPEKYGRFSALGARVTEEVWQNADGTTARGWLLRGAENAPAVVLLHRYGADRSHNLNLGVKLNETTDFTILMPDQRGHAENPSVKYSSFGGCENNREPRSSASGGRGRVGFSDFDQKIEPLFSAKHESRSEV